MQALQICEDRFGLSLIRCVVPNTDIGIWLWSDCSCQYCADDASINRAKQVLWS